LQVSDSILNEVETFCYGGKTSLDSISDTWTSSKDRPTLHGVTSWDLKDYQRWAKEMPVGERISWAIGGMVLTAGLIFISKREDYRRRRKQASVAQTVRKKWSRELTRGNSSDARKT